VVYVLHVSLEFLKEIMRALFWDTFFILGLGVLPIKVHISECNFFGPFRP